MNEDFNDDTFILYAAKHYDNPHCFDINEFYDDLKRFKYLKRLLIKYKDNKDLRERLILNHIIVLYNVFGDVATKMLFDKIDKDCWNALVTFLVYLNRMPDTVPEYGINLSDIKLDEAIIEVLRKI